MGNHNTDTGRSQGQEKNIQNPGQNPNTKNPQQGQNQGRQQGFDKNEEISEKEDLYGNQKNQGGMNRPQKH